MLKQSLLFLLNFLVLAAINGQDRGDYILYHNQVNQANRLGYEKDYAQSLALFQEAFEKVEYVHAASYAKAARVAAKEKQYDLTKEYLLEAVNRGYPRSFISSNVFKKFRKKIAFEAFLAALNAAEQDHLTQVNQDYIHQLDSLHYIDQRILRGNKRVGGFELDPAQNYSDSLNFKHLLQLIDRHGFPSEERIGHQAYRKAWIILHHNVRLPQNHYFQPRLLEALKRGEYQPENYCWVVDQGLELKGEPLLYYHWDVAKNIDQLSVEERQRIDQARKAVGLASIDRIEVVKNKQVIKNKVRW